MIGYFARMRAYLGEMLPVPSHLLIAALTQLGIVEFADHIHDQTTPWLSRHTLIGIWSIFNLFLILRLMDELKDRDLDRDLFPERPLPAGRVLETDIKLSLAGAVAAYLIVNLAAGPAFWTALVVIGYALLMFRLFFIPDILRNSLLLSLLTHQPIVPLILLHGIAIFAAQHAAPPGELRWALLLPYAFLIWMTFLSWELSRKIRAPGEETAYMTYSRIFGPRGAVLLAGAVQAVAIAIGVTFFVTLDLSWAYLIALLAAFGSMLWAYRRFLNHPSPRTSALRPFAEAFVVIVLAAQLLEFAWAA